MKIKLNNKALKDARDKAGLSRDKLVKKLNSLGIEAVPSTIQAWESESENFTPRAIVLFFGLCKVLQIEPEKCILTETENESPANAGQA